MEHVDSLFLPATTVRELEKIKHKQRNYTLSYNKNLLLMYLSVNEYGFLVLPTKSFAQVAERPTCDLIDNVTHRHNKVLQLMRNLLKTQDVDRTELAQIMLLTGEALMTLFYGKCGRLHYQTSLSILPPDLREVVSAMVAGWITLVASME